MTLTKQPTALCLQVSTCPEQPCEAAHNSGVSGTLSNRLWGLDLYERLPIVLTHDEVVAQRGELSRVRAFLNAEFPTLTEEALSAPSSELVARAKRTYLETDCDSIELRHRGRTVGVLLGAPEDWSSYYIRIFAVTQSYQRPALIRRFGRECLFERLAAHEVQRVLADTSPVNIAMSRTLSELHFHVTGHQLSDRWGPLVRYTKFLDRACEDAFLKRFAGTAPPGSAGSRKEIEP
jgi:hypothetical protein